MADDAGAGTGEYEEDLLQKTEAEKVEEKSMTPWEQHSAVISLPRFDYNAPSSLLQNSHCGFLITCTIKREKSATKEAMSILGKYGVPFNSDNDESLGNPEKNNNAKRRRIQTEDIDGKCLDLEESKSDIINSEDGKFLKGTCLSSTNAEIYVDRLPGVSLVKLTRSGLLLFTFPSTTSPDTVDIVSNIIQSLESRSVLSPVWCHRIFPIQATCSLKEKELLAVVSMLVKKFVAANKDQLARPLKFAVGYNRRGIEDTKFLKDNSNESSSCHLLDRNKCFGIVASTVKHVVEDSVVDLKSPELSVLVELLPLSGVPNGSIVVAVSVLPRNLVSTKPRLCIKALTSNTKGGSGPQ